MKRYQKLMVALAAVASLYLVRATGLDKGLIDQVLDALIEAVVAEPEPVEVPVLEAPAAPEGN
jgi:hypothetical protein